MPRKKTVNVQRLARLDANSDTWKTKYERSQKKLIKSEMVRKEQNKRLVRMEVELDDALKYIEAVKAADLENKYEQLTKEHDKTKKMLEVTQAEEQNWKNQLKEEFQKFQTEREVKTEKRLKNMYIEISGKLDSSLHRSADFSTQLELVTNELMHLKQLDMLNVKKGGLLSPKQLTDDLKEAKSANRKLNKQLESQEERIQKMYTPLKPLEVNQTPYLDRNSVIRCENFMKSGVAIPSPEFNHLLTGIVKRAVARDRTCMQLTPEETFILKSSTKLSNGNFRTMKAIIHKYMGFDILANRDSVTKVVKTLDTTSNYTFDMIDVARKLPNGNMTNCQVPRASIKDLQAGIANRLQTLAEHGLLLDEDDIVICLQGDKGSEETKLCISIENVTDPNSPYNLLLVCMYEGQDDEEDMKQFASDVLQMWDDLLEVKYTGKDGTDVTKKVTKKLIGDMKFLSALLGHRGQACSHPCYICQQPWSTSGSQAFLLEQLDLSFQPVLRTHNSYVRDAIRGENGVKKGVHSLCNTEPADIVIPTIHTVQGTFVKYFENYINGEVNSMDRTDDKSAKTLKAHKKNLAAMIKEEKTTQKTFDDLLKAKDEAYSAATAYNLISKNQLSHLRTPETLCDSKWCIINHLQDRKTDEWIECDSCKKYFHFSCCVIFAPDAKFEAKNLKNWSCNDCSKWDLSKFQTAAFNTLQSLNIKVQSSYDHLASLIKKREDLDSLLHKSTGAIRKKFETFLASIGCDVRTWYQTLCGNQVRKLLREDHIDSIFEILRDSPQNLLVMKAMKGLAKVMSFSNNRIYDDKEIDEVELVLLEFLSDMKAAFPKETLTPKLHTLAFHLIPFMRKHKSWGRTSEQGIEHCHAQVNNLKRYFHPIRNKLERYRLITRELGMRNWLHDSGAY